MPPAGEGAVGRTSYDGSPLPGGPELGNPAEGTQGSTRARRTEPLNGSSNWFETGTYRRRSCSRKSTEIYCKLY